jgi:hypothetical protein
MVVTMMIGRHGRHAGVVVVVVVVNILCLHVIHNIQWHVFVVHLMKVMVTGLDKS